MLGQRTLTFFLLLACSPAQRAEPPEAPAQSGAAHAKAHVHAQPETAPAPPQHASEGHATHGFHKDFSDAAGFAKHFDDPERDVWQQPAEVIGRLRIAPGQVVVDLGAGTGYFLPALSRAVGPNGQVLALDVEPKMIEFMQRRMSEQRLDNVTPRQVAGDNPGLARGSVDRVLIVNTWHHIDARAEYARKLAEALLPAGEIWIVDFTLESDRGPPARHRLAPEQVVRELEEGGLRAEIVQPEPLPNQYLVRAWRDCPTCKGKAATGK